MGGDRDAVEQVCIPEHLDDAVGEVAFFAAADLYELMRGSNLTGVQMGYVLGIAGKMFLTALSEERGGELTEEAVAVFGDAIVQGLVNSESLVGINDINNELDGVIADVPGSRNSFISKSAEVPVVAQNPISDKNQGGLGRFAAQMAVSDFNGLINNGLYSMREVAFAHGLALKMLIDIANKTPGQEKLAQPVSAVVADGFAHGFSQPVNTRMVEAFDFQPHEGVFH